MFSQEQQLYQKQKWSMISNFIKEIRVLNSMILSNYNFNTTLSLKKNDHKLKESQNDRHLLHIHVCMHTYNDSNTYRYSYTQSQKPEKIIQSHFMYNNKNDQLSAEKERMKC